MSRKQTVFFATHADLAAVVRDVMAVRPIDIVQGGLSSEPSLVVLTDADDLREFETYLIVDRGAPVNLREVPQRAGGLKYAVDQVDNAHSVVLQTGGKYTAQHLIAGQAGTVGGNKQSDDLYAVIAKDIRKRFEKVKSYYVGPEAASMLDGGLRLSATPNAPPTYDLVR